MSKWLRKLGGPPGGLGIASYTEEEFLLLKQRAKDADSMDDTFAAWRRQVRSLMKSLRLRGVEVVLVPITVAEIEAYCEERGLENTGDTRARLVVEKLDGRVASEIAENPGLWGIAVC